MNVLQACLPCERLDKKRPGQDNPGRFLVCAYLISVDG